MNERQLLVRFGADLSPFEKALLQANKSARQFAGEVTSLGKTLSASITVPLTAAAAAAVASSETIDDAMDRIRIGTGATGDDLEKLGDTFRNVFGEMPESAEQVSTAIADLNTRLNLSGDDLQAMTTQMLELARVSGSEVGPLIEGSAKAFQNWGVATGDQSRELDFLWKVVQSTGIGIEELTGTMASSGSTLRATGLDFETAASLIGQFRKAGVDSGTVIAGLTKGATAFAKEGQSMADGLRATVEQIKGAVSPSEAAQIAVDKFGKSGIAMADAIRKGALDIDSFLATLRNSPETIHKAAQDTAGLGEAFNTLKNKVTLALEPLGVAITKVMIDLANIAGKIVDNVLNPLMQAFGRLPDPVQSAVVVMGGVVAAIGPVLIALGGMISTFAAVSTALVGVKATAAASLASLTTLFPSAAGAVAAATSGIGTAFASISGIAASVVAGVGGIAASLASFALPAAAAVAAIALIVYNWDTLKGAMIKGAQAITTGLSAAWSAVSSGASSAWSGIKSVVSSAVNSVLDIARSMGSALVAAAKAAMGPYYDTVAGGIGQVASYANQQWESLKAGASSFASSIASSMSNALASVSSSVAGMIAKFGEAISAANRSKQALAAGAGSAGRGLMEFDPSVNAAIRGATSSSVSTPGVISGGSLMPGGGGGAGRVAEAPHAPLTMADFGQSAPGGGFQQVAPSRDWMNRAPTPSTPYTPYTFSDPYLAAGQQSISDYNAAGQQTLRDFYGSRGGGSPKLGFSGPRLADGGIVTSPTIAMIGEAGPEAVVPLTGSRGRGMMGGMGGGEVHIHVHVNGSVQTKQDLVRELGRPMRDELNRIQRNGGAA